MLPVFSSPRVTIIDCGATRTSLGAFKLTAGRLQCVHLAVEPFACRAPGEDTWLENTTAALPLLGAGRHWPGPTVLVLPAHLPLTKQIKAPRVAPAKRAKIIRFEAEQAIPHALTEVVWDTVVSGQTDATEDILLVAAKREILEQLCAAAQAAGFRPVRILPSPLATLAGFRVARPGLVRPALVLNLGSRSSTLLQVEATRFAARTLTLDGGPVTRPLDENQDCVREEGERSELSAGRAEVTAEARETWVDRLAQETSRSILHFGRQCGLPQPEKIFLTGGGARLPGLARLLGARLKLPVEILDATGAVGFSEMPPTDAALVDLIGAAAIGLRPSQPAMDLLPPARRRSENLRRGQPWLIAAAVLAAAAPVPPIRHFQQVALTARAEVAAMEATLAPLRARERRNRGNLVRLEQLKIQAARLRSVHDRRTSWVRLLAGLEERLVKVEDVWLETLAPVTPGVDGPLKLAVSGRMLVPTGAATAARARQLLAAMGGLPSVTAVEGKRFDASQPGELGFDFVLVTDPAHPL